MADQEFIKSRQEVSATSRTAPPQGQAPEVSGDAFENTQLSLFQTFLINTDEERSSLSNAVDLWDQIPRYSVSRLRTNALRTSEGFLDAIDLSFQYRGRTLIARIHPARVFEADGKRMSYYPGNREEIIEHALRRLAAEQHTGFFDAQARRSGARFSLYQLRKELERQGHSLRYDELKQGLDILSMSTIEIIATNESGDEAFARSTYLVSLTGVTRRDYDSDRTARWTVQFHPLVTHAIDQVTYRQFNYSRLTKCSTQLARWLLTQLVLKYTQAAISNTFDMRFSTIRRDSAMLDGYSRMRDAIKLLDEALAELKGLGALLGVKKTELRGPRNKIEDVVYTLSPTPEFVREQKAANRRSTDSKDGPASTETPIPGPRSRTTAYVTSSPQSLDQSLTRMMGRLRHGE